MSNPEAVLELERVVVRLKTRHEVVEAVRGVSLTLRRGRILALVGESGSGKSMTARAVLRLLPSGADVAGHIWFGGQDLLQLSPAEIRKIRGRSLALVFQNPQASLNPTLTIGALMRETLRAHGEARQGWQSTSFAALLEAGFDAEDRQDVLRAYPFELSGGQQQRAALALAVALGPTVLLADEITTGLDVTTQARVLDRLRQLVISHARSALLITHDLGVAARWADDLAVMNAGEIVETGPFGAVFSAPRHPFTRHLLRTQPRLLAGHSREACEAEQE